MYPKFIEVHGKGEPYSVNTAHIVFFTGGHIRTSELRNRDALVVDESYDELKQLITDAGCIIAKADPRLDMTTPLTMDDLKGMIGEPVWNDNAGKWMLVNYIAADQDGNDSVAWFTLPDTRMYAMNKTDLIKFPLYRMRKTE